MAHHPSLRAKAVEWRTTQNLTIDEIAARLALSRTTVYYWVRDIPIPESTARTAARLSAARANVRRAKALREAAYARGTEEYADLARDPTFRDFVCMYIGEGFKRSRNRVALCNSDPVVIVLATRWIRRFAERPVRFSVQYHADQDLVEIQRFWATLLDVKPDEITLQRKSNSSGLAHRKWRSRHGVLTVTANDTMFRARLQAWMDLIRQTWV